MKRILLMFALAGVQPGQILYRPSEVGRHQGWNDLVRQSHGGGIPAFSTSTVFPNGTCPVDSKAPATRLDGTA